MKKMKNVAKKMGNSMREFAKEESGMGTVEVVFIIAALIALVLVFRNQIKGRIEGWVGALGNDDLIPGK